MRNMLAFFAFCLLTFAIVGGWLGWYTPRTTRAADGKPSLSIDFNPQKIGADLKAANEAIERRLAEQAARAAEARKAAESAKK